MSRYPFPVRRLILGSVALGALALAGCVVDNPPRPGVDYGYVGGAYSTGGAVYDGSPYYGEAYGGTYYGSPYYGPSYYPGYYGPNATFVYTRDHYYPVYQNPPRGGHDHDHDHDGHNGGWQGNGPGGGYGGGHGNG
ncbi:MAG: hypothetical protein ACREVL_03170, partial [Solimonas sp.]